jgi:hypothetical protein
MSGSRFQLRFDAGHQQRYFSDRRSLLECVLRVSRQSPDPRFEIWREGAPVRLSDGRLAGKRYELAEVLDLSEQGQRERLAAEVQALQAKGGDDSST